MHRSILTPSEPARVWDTLRAGKPKARRRPATPSSCAPSLATCAGEPTPRAGQASELFTPTPSRAGPPGAGLLAQKTPFCSSPAVTKYLGRGGESPENRGHLSARLPERASRSESRPQGLAPCALASMAGQVPAPHWGNTCPQVEGAREAPSDVAGDVQWRAGLTDAP